MTSLAYAESTKIVARFIDGKLRGSQPVWSSSITDPDPSTAFNRATEWADTDPSYTVQVIDREDWKPSQYENYVGPKPLTAKEKFLLMLEDSDVKDKIKNIKDTP